MGILEVASGLSQLKSPHNYVSSLPKAPHTASLFPSWIRTRRNDSTSCRRRRGARLVDMTSGLQHGINHKVE
jgi:hypothetical protein